jgi:hypothetical protein
VAMVEEAGATSAAGMPSQKSSRTDYPILFVWVSVWSTKLLFAASLVDFKSCLCL